MPIVNLQRTMRQLGRIRMGSQVPTSNGKMRPAKLEKWRLTSKYEEYLDNAAAIYGGTVQEWAGAPDGGQWELFTESDTLEVIIPPGDMAFSQWMELWSGGGCTRRCDSEMEQLSNEPCMCPSDPETRVELAAKGQACKPTTRLSVIQPKLPDIGLWRVETHGYYGAIELAGSIEVLRSAQSVSGLIPARLRIDQRSAKRDGKTINYAVPVIELPSLTPHALMTGEKPAEIGPARRELPVPRPALEEVPSGSAAPATQLPGSGASPSAPSATAIKPAAASANNDGGGAFARAIKAAGKRAGIDPDRLSGLAVATVGKGITHITDGAEANLVLEAIKNLGKTPVAAGGVVAPDGQGPDGSPF